MKKKSNMQKTQQQQFFITILKIKKKFNKILIETKTYSVSILFPCTRKFRYWQKLVSLLLNEWIYEYLIGTIWFNLRFVGNIPNYWKYIFANICFHW